MKTKAIVSLFLLFGGTFFLACSSSDGNSDGNSDLPTQAVETAFFAKYPSASNVNWESKGVFQQADFTIGRMEYEASFNRSGIWLQTEYTTTYSNLPSGVKDLIANNINYPPTLWTPMEAVDVLERRNYPKWYEIELKNGAQEIEIWADTDGYAGKVITDDLDGNEIPQDVRNFIAINYKNGFISMAVKLENNSYEVYLLDGENVKIVYFNSSMSWTHTEWAVALPDVPQKVKAVLESPAYQEFSVRSVSYWQNSAGDRYYFILTQPDMQGPDTNLYVDLNGNIIPN